MNDNKKKDRLNLQIGTELLRRLENCANRYGVSRGQMAVMLIGQGVASIEEGFKLSEKYVGDILNQNKIEE